MNSSDSPLGGDNPKFEERRKSVRSVKTTNSEFRSRFWPESLRDIDNAGNDDISVDAARPENFSDQISFVLSLFHVLIFTLITIVFTVSHYSHERVTDEFSDIYFTILLVVGTIWYICFHLFKKKFCKDDQEELNVSQEPSNRWLKGVLGLFGVAVITSESLKLGNGIVMLNICANPLAIIQPVIQACFVAFQLSFLFHYAKLYIPRLRHISRFGLSHVLATNLSIWIRSIAEETDTSLKYASKNLDKNNSANLEDYFNLDNCTCNTSFCHTSDEFRHFLFPFQIEFCLISGCLIYIMWRHIGKLPSRRQCEFEPCHSFLKSYKGLFVGALSMVLTVLVMVVLATSNEESEFNGQHIFDGYIMLCNVLILFSCLICFYLKLRQKVKFPTKFTVNLDVVLLFVCLIGPFMLDLFSVVALSFGNKEEFHNGWEMTLVLSILDIFVNIVMVIFTVFGLSCIPISASSSETTGSKRGDVMGKWNETFSGEEQSPSERFQESLPTYSTTNFSAPTERCVQLEGDESAVKEESISSDDEEIVTVMNSENEAERSEQEKDKSVATESRCSSPTRDLNPERIDIEICSSSSNEKPERSRIIYRDFLVFLFLVNASMWAFFSFNGTIYKVSRLESEFYGHATWIMFKSVTSPLAIYFKMHLAACLFEVWTIS